ncbi:hypothetical protein OMP40_20250 [Cohnella rhizosphaerae]|uniref:Oligopeptide/dipeptide ABC transporter C-terminal domain-containing protein n=2 Tax=Cohnella rhizosphaerae TaxID=1457232 RepID=A0A9X4KW69_9BACL|nr:oligopeptide/dipeptide ABC transporter ATP-binding protein [Cohnella rhizosphaerae]MDG0811441.1 hypothetical protein [Cohnella rhizosphaerae]
MHPYTQGLLASIPDIHEEVDVLETIEGLVPNVYDMPTGCRFAPRCKHAMDRCARLQPALAEAGKHKVRCFLHSDALEEDAE